MNDADQDFHASFKPSWGLGNVLVYVMRDRAIQTAPRKGRNSTTHIDNHEVHLLKLDVSPDVSRVISPRPPAANGYQITPANFSKQRSQTKVSVQDGVPLAEHIPTPFDTEYPETTTAHQNEQLAWELASILFDTYDDEISENVPLQQRDFYDQRIRKDRLAAFWSHLCRNEALTAVSMARTTEERAIAYLSMNAVIEACNVLSEGKDYRLATLVAQIGGDKIMQEEMRAQIDSWRKLNVLSEMSDPIRALYELLAGNTCTCEGKKGPLEDRAKTFTISGRFGMDWKRAFGLKLWYSTLVDEPLEIAIERFAADLKDKEPSKPLPWFLTLQDVTLAWSDPHGETREDVLWGILSLYAERSSETKTKNLIQVVMPENVVGHPLQSRLSFELYHALSPHFPTPSSSLPADQLALGFAAELESADQWLWSLFALLHLSDIKERQLALQAHIARHAASIGEHDHDLLQTLFVEFRIPEPWVWEAKALHARTVLRDHEAEVRFLLRARNWSEAHRALCAAVAPRAIISRDHAALSKLLDDFAHEDRPHDWRVGGGVYVDYLHLLRCEEGAERRKVVGRLLGALAEMKRRVGGDLLQSVAVQEMSGVVAEKVLAGKNNVSFFLQPNDIYDRSSFIG